MVINVRIHRMMMVATGATFLILAVILLTFMVLSKDQDGAVPEPMPQDAAVYGEFLPWNEVDKLFSRGSTAVVVDVDSGNTFQVQRRAGSSHVDAQPLTAADTAAMKQAYDGRWSWRRKAIIVVLPDGRKIAASMAGMPHGQGAIPNNDFNGHFCIHFRDSKTHGSHKVDLAHQMMIWKASGTIDEHTEALDREGVIALLFTALDQREYNIASQLIHPDIDINPILPQLQRIERIKYDNLRALADNEFTADVRIIFDGSTQEVRQKTRVAIYREGPPWKVAASSLIPLLEPVAAVVTNPMDGWYSQEDWEQ